MSCQTVLEVAQFVPNAVEAEANTVKFGPTNVEGEVVMWSEAYGLDVFFLQQKNSATETEAAQFEDYTDGYAVRLKYHWPVSSADGTYAACLTSEVKAQQSCWAITIGTNAVSGTKSFYQTTVSDGQNLHSAGVALTQTCAWNAGFHKLWSISYESDGSNHSVTGSRFLPSLVNDVSPTGDFRFAPTNSENPDQASDTAVWIYAG